MLAKRTSDLLDDSALSLARMRQEHARQHRHVQSFVGKLRGQDALDLPGAEILDPQAPTRLACPRLALFACQDDDVIAFWH